MTAYQAIPRKYRPKRFSEVVGHEAIVTTLKNALKLGRVSQGYLFCGSRGTGKTTLARLFAKALNCLHLEDGEPCNECACCKDFLRGNSLDIIEIDGASHRGIEDIRQLNEAAGYAPSLGKYKIYIIDEVHMLTKEAFNALLKTLEEPPATVKFLFATTEPHKVPATILSRCQRFDLKTLPLAAIKNKLQLICQDLAVTIEEPVLALIALRADGSLRDAETLLDRLLSADTQLTLASARELLGLLPQEFFFALDQAISSGDTKAALALSDELFTSGRDLSATIDALLDHFRTILLLTMKQTPAFVSKEEEARYQKSASAYTNAQCLALIDLLIDWQQQLLKTPFKRIHLEMLLLNLVRSYRRPSLDELVSRLIALEERPQEVKQQEEPKPTPPAPVVQSAAAHPSRYDTLMRFAAVELEGTVTNTRS